MECERSFAPPNRTVEYPATPLDRRDKTLQFSLMQHEGAGDSAALVSRRMRTEPWTRGNSQSQDFLPYVHSFRAIAIIGVVATHVTDTLDWGGAGGLVCDLSYSLFQNGSVLFVFVAGLLFQYLGGRFQYRAYLKNKLKNVILPYVVVSAPTLVQQFRHRAGVFQAGTSSHPHLLRALESLLGAGHMPRPLWFIPMIAVIYFMAPLFIYVDRHPRWYWSLVPLLIVAELAHRPMVLNSTLHAVVYFLPSYLAGMLVGRYRETIVQRLQVPRVQLGLAGLFAALILLETTVLHRGGALFSEVPFGPTWSLDVNQMAKLVFSLLVLGLLANASQSVHKRFDFLAGASFGVFFVHEYVIRGLLKTIQPTPTGSIVNLIGMTTAILVLTSITVAVVRRIAGKRSRMLIGC